MNRLRLYILFIAIISYSRSNAQFTTLIWSDEFSKKGLPDSTKWSYDTGGHGWGNKELQFYTEKRFENVRVNEGKLIIEAHKEDYKTSHFTSTRLTSKEKGDWKYGRIEVKAKLPKGKGVWPAIWMLPTHWKYGGWPKSGEIDIMENVGYLPDSLYGTVHTSAFNHVIGTQKVGAVMRKDLADSFHVYAIEWTADSIAFFLDNEKYHTFENNKSGPMHRPFDQAFHLLLNVAVGGNWGGKFGIDETIFPQRFEIDYVRVYQ